MSNDWIAVGRLLRTRGNRGELAGEIYSSHPERAQALKEVMLDVNGRRRPALVERIWRHDGRPVFKFAGIDSISEAEPWAGADVLVPEGERAEPAPGEYSHADLIGCSVVGTGIGGVVKEVEDYGGTPLLKVQALDGREVLVPFARSICTEIDIAAKIIRVELPDGLLDLP